MNAMENLLTRRSVRSYKSDMVDRKTLDRILKAGTYAATGMNKQAPIIIAVTNREMRDRIPSTARRWCWLFWLTALCARMCTTAVWSWAIS